MTIHFKHFIHGKVVNFVAVSLGLTRRFEIMTFLGIRVSKVGCKMIHLEENIKTLIFKMLLSCKIRKLQDTD